jgi:hypothetical protein
MRALIERDGEWVRETPKDFSSWMRLHDGAQAVVVDDVTKTYYCGKESIREEYSKNGKKAKMFADLDQQLFVSMGTDDREQPHYCLTGDAWCSSKLPTNMNPTPCLRCSDVPLLAHDFNRASQHIPQPVAGIDAGGE